MKLLNKLKYDLSKYNKLELITAAISAMLLIWLILSFFNITNNNMTTCIYAEWNLIILIQELFESF